MSVGLKANLRGERTRTKSCRMNSRIVGLRVAGATFGLVCVLHVLRLFLAVDVIVAGRHLPMWMSVAGAIFTGVLSIWFWRLSSKDN